MTGLPVRVVSDAILGRDPYLVQRRTHRKRRTNKKWRKRYGMVTRYRYFETVYTGDVVYMAMSMYRALQRRTTDENST